MTTNLEKRIKDVIDPVNDGIILSIYNDETSLGEFIKSIISENEAKALDIEYVYNHSGLKLISTLLILGQELYNGFTDELKHKVNSIIKVRFCEKWKKLYNTLIMKYDIISPYDMKIEEKGTNDITISKNAQDVLDRKDTNSKSENSTNNINDKTTSSIDTTTNEVEDGSINSDDEHKVSGYNNDEYVKDTHDITTDTSKNTTNGTSNTKRDDTRTKTDTYENNTRKDTIDKTESETRENPTTRSITRIGNIGNITRQQLINEEREMLKWQFFNVVFDDIDTVVTRGMF